MNYKKKKLITTINENIRPMKQEKTPHKFNKNSTVSSHMSKNICHLIPSITNMKDRPNYMTTKELNVFSDNIFKLLWGKVGILEPSTKPQRLQNQTQAKIGRTVTNERQLQ